jgi:hypothetical protein
MQGISIDDRWPTSKKEVKEVLASEPERIKAIATSLFGDEFNGKVHRLPTHQEVHFAGPDVHADRRFYGTIKWNKSKTKLVLE